MGETFEVSLEVRGPRERVIAELRAIEAVAAVKELGGGGVSTAPNDGAAEGDLAADGSADSVRLLVTAADRTDIREAVFYRLAQAGLPLLEMKRESLSLEDIFLKLTTDEPEADGEGFQAAGEEVAADA